MFRLMQNIEPLTNFCVSVASNKVHHIDLPSDGRNYVFSIFAGALQEGVATSCPQL